MEKKFTNKFGRKVRGVNLGGWLVLEKWMTPSLFEGLHARDETTFCVELGSQAKDRLSNHWNTFITEEDFVWIAQKGVNAVRIPVGHWIFGPPYPYHNKYGKVEHPFVEGGIDILDSAFTWAERNGLLVVIDFHAAPGCQNGFDNGGILGVVDWPNKSEYIEHSLNTLEKLADRYKQRECLLAIEVLNEPHWDIPTNTLKDYTLSAYSRIRKHCDKKEVSVIFSDGFRSYKEYSGFMQEPDYTNVIFDIHRYQCFNPGDINMDIYGHIQKSAIQWKNEADELILDSGFWTYIGEWSLGLNPEFVDLWDKGPFNKALSGMDDFQKDVALRAYGAAQLASFEKYLGWFFWSYKTETMPEWCFRECVKKGWLPDNFS